MLRFAVSKSGECREDKSNDSSGTVSSAAERLLRYPRMRMAQPGTASISQRSNGPEKHHFMHSIKRIVLTETALSGQYMLIFGDCCGKGALINCGVIRSSWVYLWGILGLQLFSVHHHYVTVSAGTPQEEVRH